MVFRRLKKSLNFQKWFYGKFSWIGLVVTVQRSCGYSNGLWVSSLGSILFVFLRLMFRLFIVFSPSLFWVWVILDLSTIFLIPYLVSKGVLATRWYKGVAMYFVVQFIGSAMIFYSIIEIRLMRFAIYGEWALLFGFILKLGLFPFHFWVPRVFANMHYGGIFIVGAVQKVFIVCAVPIMFESSVCSSVAYIRALGSVILGPVAIFYTNDVKTFLAYSSVNNTGLMAICNIIRNTLLEMYAFVYVIRIGFLVMIFARYDGDRISGIGSGLPDSYSAGFFSIASRFSGFPPFTDFCLKFAVLISCAENAMWRLVCGVLIRRFINLLVWVWLLALNFRTFNLLERTVPTYTEVLNITCVIWNIFGGILLITIY